MNIHRVVDFHPLIGKPENGSEPSLHHLVLDYYLRHDISMFDAQRYTKQYFDAINKQADQLGM